MKGSLVILCFFAAGVACGWFFADLDVRAVADGFALAALYVLVFLVGVGIGANREAWKVVRSVRAEVLLVPVATIVGTLAGGALASLALGRMGLLRSLTVASGFGYYSLSSVIVARADFPTLAVVALLANMTREIFTLVMTPLLARYLGRLAPICSGGATTMDTTLPIISAYSGRSYAIISVFHGLVLTIVVPFLVTLLLKLM